jgi:hypothetical protein
MRRALPVALLVTLLIGLACASSSHLLRRSLPEGSSLSRPVEVLFTGDMRGKIEPCG